MTELFPIPLFDQIAAVSREITLREKVYPRWVAQRKMTQAKANREIAAMKAVFETLIRLPPDGT